MVFRRSWEGLACSVNMVPTRVLFQYSMLTRCMWIGGSHAIIERVRLLLREIYIPADRQGCCKT